MTQENYQAMTQEGYQNLVNTYGVHPSRWPEDMRAIAMSFAQNNPQHAIRINADAAFLDKIMDTAALPIGQSNGQSSGQNDLLMARIIKATEGTTQKPRQKIITPANDHPTKFLPDDEARAPMSRWKVLAATLLVTTGIGFGLGQSAAARSDYWAAETLYSYNVDTETATTEWLEAQE